MQLRDLQQAIERDAVTSLTAQFHPSGKGYILQANYDHLGRSRTLLNQHGEERHFKTVDTLVKLAQSLGFREVQLTLELGEVIYD